MGDNKENIIKKVDDINIENKPNDTIFRNNFVKNALKSLTPEQLEHYQQIGEGMYDTVDFTKGEILNNIDPPTEEKLAYIITGLKSGLLPQDLEQEEIELMIEHYGQDWFKHFGIKTEDLSGVAEKLFEEGNKYKKCGRNTKCPCGSGKKYKVCHLGKVNMIPKLIQQQTLNVFKEKKK